MSFNPIKLNMVSDFKMKRLKTYNLFNESKDYDLSIISDMLLDFTDKDINVKVSDGSWSHLGGTPVEYVKVSIGRTHGLKFKVEGCILDVIDYLSSSGLFLMKESWFWSDMWQHYQGCPNCLSDDFEDNYPGVFTRCNKCGYVGDPDRFLLDQWPVTIERLDIAISEGKRVEQIELFFSDKNLFKTFNESFTQSETDEIKSTVGDMLLELDFQSIRSGVWVLSENVIQVELKKEVKERSSAVLWGDRDENRGFEWSDVQEVIDVVSDYLSQWGFKPQWESDGRDKDTPKFEVRANWYDGGGENPGYDTCVFLRWVTN
jgi:hypothetical protein